MVFIRILSICISKRAGVGCYHAVITRRVGFGRFIWDLAVVHRVMDIYRGAGGR